MRRVTWAEVCRQRLARSHLLHPAAPARLVDVVAAVCGVQAQVLSAAELAIGVRVSRLTRQDVRRALWERRSLIKTYGPRGTLHLLPARELSLWMAAMRGRADLRGTRWYQASGLEPARAEALLEAIGEALDGRCLTREELAQQVARRIGAWVREPLSSTWGVLLGPAAYTGRLCFGPSRGSKVTFVRADQWAGTVAWKELDSAAALAEVCRRYLATYGPARPEDFGRWFGLIPEEARRALDSLAGELEEVEVDGSTGWVRLAAAKSVRPAESPTLRLLPQYDCYVLGCGPLKRVVPEPARTRVRAYGRGQWEGAVALPVLLIDGVVAGMWQSRQRARRIELRVEPFGRLSPSLRRQLDLEAERIGEFLGSPVALSLGRLE